MYKDEQDRLEDADPDEPIPSLSMTSLTASEPEVAQIFHLPLCEIVQPARLRLHQFRGWDPYWAIDVSDIAGGTGGVGWAAETSTDEVGGGQKGKLEVWGLTGWYTNIFMRAIEVFQ